MLEAAASLEFEEAARYRDEIRKLEELEMKLFPETEPAG
jgi:excinuclease UvrABC nuclease subunit